MKRGLPVAMLGCFSSALAHLEDTPDQIKAQPDDPYGYFRSR